MVTATAEPATQMKAVVFTQHGPPENLQLRDVAVPTPKDRQVLVSVRAAAINPLDWHVLRGEPGFIKMMVKRHTEKIPGVDFAGVVQKVGAKVTQFRPGDEVFGATRPGAGTLAQYACTKAGAVARKPAGLTFEQAATIPVAGCTALQAMSDHARVQAGQSVLVNGAAGGVGTFAVQIGRAFGAEVTGVCSTRNLEFVRALGAHHVIDYTAEDFTQGAGKYDVIIQTAGNQKNDQLRRALKPRGSLVLVGGGTGREIEDIKLLEVLGMFAANFAAPFMRQKTRLMMGKIRNGDLQFIAELMVSGKVTPVIDRTYLLAEAAEAIRYLEAGHARGKVVIAV